MMKTPESPFRKLVLGSASPRRLELAQYLGLPVEQRVRSIDETVPEGVRGTEVAEWLAREKATAQLDLLQPDEVLLTGDTVVVLDGELLEKPTDAQDAHRMLRALSGRTHTVASGFALTTIEHGMQSGRDEAQVTFLDLSDEVIWHYINKYKPFDKAGAYGIQEWIGAVGVSRIDGSYYTIMGLPIHLVFKQINTALITN